MLHSRTTLFALGAALMFSGSAQAADLKAGKALHDKHCMQCHDTSVYTREDRRVTSLSALKNQVRRCEQSLDLRWFEDSIADVTHYLNETYYHFE